MKAKSPQKQLDAFLAKYTPDINALARALLAKMRARLPGAVEMVYDNFNALVIGFGPTERPSEAYFSLVLYPRWVNLYFLQGAKLSDPSGLLQGSGNVGRYFRFESEDDWNNPALQELISLAISKARVPLEADGLSRIIIKSVSENQRPRRPAQREQ